MERLSPELLAEPVEGVNLRPGTLADQLDGQETLLVFLRHFGCIFSRECVVDLREAMAADPSYPPVLYFYQGTVGDGEAFFPAYDPKARAVADLPRRFYRAFGLGRGTLGQMFGGAVWACGLRAARKGLGVGRPVGDPWVMPGMFLVRGDRVVWQYLPAHAGDHPDFGSIPRLAGLSRGESEGADLLQAGGSPGR